jgi:hypothetical protein
MTQLFAGGRTQLPGVFIIALFARKVAVACKRRKMIGFIFQKIAAILSTVLHLSPRHNAGHR